MLIRKKCWIGDDLDHLPYDEEKERFYQNVFAGFVSPGPNEGVIVVCGLEKVRRPPARIFWLAESCEFRPEELINKALALKQEFKISEFFSFNDESFFRYLITRNAIAREERKRELHINRAPHAETDNISYHILMLQGLLDSTKKTLILGQSPALREALQGLSKTETATATARLYPRVAALGYCVSALNAHCVDFGRDGPEFAQMDYDIESILDR